MADSEIKLTLSDDTGDTGDTFSAAPSDTVSASAAGNAGKGEPAEEKVNTILVRGIPRPIDNLTQDDLNLLLEDARTDEKGNKELPDEVVARYYKYLPDGVRNYSHTRRCYYGGTMMDFSGGGERAHEVAVSGGKALQAKIRRRLSFRDTLSDLLATAATPEQIERLGLQKGATQLDAINVAMVLSASQGNRGSAEFVRDTVGERPTETQDINVNTITDADRRLLAKIDKRLSHNMDEPDSSSSDSDSQ